MRRMLAPPVSMDECILLGTPAKHPGHVFDLAVRRVNGLRNLLLGDEPPSADFARFVKLYGRLRGANVLDIVKPSEPESNYLWDIHDYQDAHEDSVRELLDLLRVEAKPDGPGIVEPVRWTLPEERRFITIRSSEQRPEDASVQICFRDRWFQIDATDTRSKRAIVLHRTLIGMRLSDPGAVQWAPVLTLPAN